LKKYTELALN